MSGTSQAAAVVSGVVALLLADNPALTPDQVKCKLLASAYSANNSDGSQRYSVFQQGAGLVSAYYAIESAESDCANKTLDIAKDLNDEEHFSGPSNINDDGNFYVEGLGEEYIWDTNNTSFSGDAMLWRTSLEPLALGRILRLQMRCFGELTLKQMPCFGEQVLELMVCYGEPVLKQMPCYGEQR